MGRRRRRRRKTSASIVLLIGVAASTWWLYRAERSTAQLDAGALIATPPEEPTPSSDREAKPLETPLAATPAPAPPLETRPAEPPPVVAPPSPADRAAGLMEAGRDAIARQDKLAARAAWNEALRLGVDREREGFLRRELTRLGDETLLSGTILAGDPHVERYVIRTGDVLAKIAASHKISPDLLAGINGIADKNLIREGQTIKILKGPFRAVVHKSTFTLDVFLGDTFVRQYPVGLGADDGTPTGEWRVGTKLVNPTYYPPRGGQIIAADDPANPLGERWIGLVGISGEAVAQQRYGIHGTNEPDTIGKNLSMGCIRMHNTDVEAVYTYLIEAHSTITVLE